MPVNELVRSVLSGLLILSSSKVRISIWFWIRSQVVFRFFRGLYPSVVRFEISDDVGLTTFVSSFRLSVTFCVMFSLPIFVAFCVTVCSLVPALPDVSCSSISFPNSISQDTAYHSLCDTLTSRSGRFSFDCTETSGMRCSRT